MQNSQTIRPNTFRTYFAPTIQRLPNTALRLPSALQVVSGIIVAIVLLPLAYLVLRALGAGQEGIEYLLDARTLAVVWNSVLLAGAVVMTAALIGVPFAWLTTRTNLPGRRFWLVAGLLTMVIPSYIGAITYVAAFGPRGLLQGLLEPLGVERLPAIYGFFGAWLAISLFTYPYVVLPVRAALLKMDPALEESARSLGLSRWQVFYRVTLPQLRPAMAAGMLLSALYALSDFGAVSMMRYDAFTRVIYVQYTSSFDRNRAAILALVLIVLTIVLLWLERRASATQHNYRIGTGCQRRSRPVNLGRWRIPALLFCGTLVGVGVVVPVIVLLLWLTQKTGGGMAGLDLAEMASNTLLASSLTAFVVGAAAIPLATLAVRKATRFNGWLVRLSYFGNVLPGLVVALALVFFASRYLPDLYQTLPMLVLGCATRFLPLSVGATRSALTQIDPRCEEAGRSLGLKQWQVMWRITVPLARTGIVGGMALVFLSVMKELPTTLLLAPTGFDTFPVEIWSAYTQASLSQIGAPALLLMAASALSLVFLLKSNE